MNLKKLIVTGFMVIFMIVPGFTANVSPSNGEDNKPLSDTPASARSRELLNRLEEIKAMDIKTMPKAEKKALHKELKAIKKEMRTLDGGLYISVGGIIIILLLLILLL
jgi:hypothetical protein